MNYKFYDLILEPVVTEKSTLVSELGKYVFRVLPSATKGSVKEAIQAILNVKVNKVNMVNINGKVKRFKGTIGKQADRKKAIVTLSSGQTINFETGGLK